MNCLVTGGAGFIGSHIVDQLIGSGHSVTVIDDLSGGYLSNINEKAKLIQKDLTALKADDPILKDIEIIYHLAAFPAEGLSVFTPEYVTQRNLTAFIKLLTASINNQVKTFSFASSMSVYGNNPNCPFDETHPRNPTDPYGICKASCERYLEIYGVEYNFNYNIIRPHNVYGIRQNLNDPYRNVIGIWINRILNGKNPIIYGDGEQLRAFSYIQDVASCMAESVFIEDSFGEIINLGGAKPYRIVDVCYSVIDAFKLDIEPLFYPPRPMEVKNAYCTTEKSEKILGYKESKNLEEGISEMVAWAKTLPKPKFKYLSNKTYEITEHMPKTWLNREM
ncbi:NAD-dependent epimerase/dehydratase family protein [Methanoculleus frigidifontis]|uniref:NAD-dependent epimerase/dehydratase family protein n=1 Tax=Methanoculleus frigidifontis TaxID=2584085 RepID=UPI0026590BE3|nr:NAD-dependent epimerase/dehydratase family protein [Methanoculleus sp. FWC-SCC1]